MQIIARCNQALDHINQPEIALLGKYYSSYLIMGLIGLFMAVLLAISLTIHCGLSFWVITGIILTAVITFFCLVIASKIIYGHEVLVYYYHEIAIMAGAAMFLSIIQAPILPYLDITILGIGCFLTFGRIGCLMVGCCHGRPCRFGVCYRPEHAAKGFTPYYVHVRLFPVQGLEVIWVLGIVLTGCLFIVRAYPPGTALTWYVVLYDCGRFCLEFLRGDAERPYFFTFSEAQWISFGLLAILCGLELAGKLPYQAAHLPIALIISVLMIIAGSYRLKWREQFWITHPKHVKELGESLALINSFRDDEIDLANIPIAITSLGIQISGGSHRSGATTICHYTVSTKSGELNQKKIEILTRLISQLNPASSKPTTIQFRPGIYHLLYTGI